MAEHLRVVPGGPGRPTSFTEETAEAILNGLADGLSLVEICQQPGLPDRRTVQRWIERDGDFAARIARARELGADAMDHEVAKLIQSVKPETAQADRVKLAALQWRAAKLNPRRYSDKQQVAVTADVAVSKVVDPVEAARQVAFALALAAANSAPQIDGKVGD